MAYPDVLARLRCGRGRGHRLGRRTAGHPRGPARAGRIRGGAGDLPRGRTGPPLPHAGHRRGVRRAHRRGQGRRPRGSSRPRHHLRVREDANA
ncbi:hypothetical protein SBRY_120018 [Actinacidiphila bryophytorum]|uniref:Uncharacterized protein n=1 Tax=Actinacidiphila bryophytorum TaxID=1436133 RepID=A0A9W4E4V3_9ACTN|nr:hypothetical protein SBRY_120018 [Actinacidiphila bryophytorum]